MSALNNLVIPEFESKEFLRTPRNPLCSVIDSTRLMIEIIGGLTQKSGESEDPEFSSKVLIGGDYALTLRYRREKDGKYYPAYTLGFDEDKFGNIHVTQLQGTKGPGDKGIAFRVNSSYNTLAYYLHLLEESFLKKGIYVGVEECPDGLEGASYSSNAHGSYNILRTAIEGLNKKYGLVKKS